MTPSFNRTSFIAYPTIPAANEEVQISMMFKPRKTTDGLLMYNAFSSDGVGDYISLSIKDERVEFRFDSGSGTSYILHRKSKFLSLLKIYCKLQFTWCH